MVTNDCSDAIIHSRIFNDDRHLRRVIKRYHTYTHSTPTAENPNAPNDAREAFLAELESFRLALSKSAMICEAEARQVEEYQRERERIGAQHVARTREYHLISPCQTTSTDA